jgi:hypothetical protein
MGRRSAPIAWVISVCCAVTYTSPLTTLCSNPHGVVVALLYPQYAFLRAIAAIVAGISSPAYPVASISTLWHFTSPFMIALEAMVVQIVLYFSLAMYVLALTLSHSLSLSRTLTLTCTFLWS